MKTYHGIPVFPGVAIGQACLWRRSPRTVPTYRLSAAEVESEVLRFQKALALTEKQIAQLEQQVAKNVGPEYSEVFGIHRILLQDKIIRDKTVEIIRRENLNAESALENVVRQLGVLFDRAPEDFLKDRRRDLLDVVERIMANLEQPDEKKSSCGSGQIIVATDLSPSQTAAIDRNQVIGLATEIGSPTSHAAILARALELPAVVGLGQILEEMNGGETVIVDGEKGLVIVQPEPQLIQEYKKKRIWLVRRQKKLKTLVHLPAETTDGHRVKLLANIEFPEEISSVKKYGAEGIGLYRTEYLYLNRRDLPSEEEQYQAYRKIAQLMRDKVVVIRTLDLGGDKFSSNLGFPKEGNPFLGWRAIRICLARQDIFIAQIKAILRAAVFGKLRIMIPMVATVEEVKQTREILRTCCAQLKKEKKPFRPDIPLGVLIEVPAAALSCDRLVGLVDFFSIGTNDLIQYSMAVDRTNERIHHLYQPCHPAIISLIEKVISTAHAAGLKVSLCGEMAATPELACLLVGLGIDELSMAPGAIPQVKETIRRVSWKKLQLLSKQLSKLPTHTEIYRNLKTSLADALPEDEVPNG